MILMIFTMMKNGKGGKFKGMLERKLTMNKTYKIKRTKYAYNGTKESTYDGNLADLIGRLNPYGYPIPRTIKGSLKNLNAESDRKYACCYCSEYWEIV